MSAVDQHGAVMPVAPAAAQVKGVCACLPPNALIAVYIHAYTLLANRTVVPAESADDEVPFPQLELLLWPATNRHLPVACHVLGQVCVWTHTFDDARKHAGQHLHSSFTTLT